MRDYEDLVRPTSTVAAGAMLAQFTFHMKEAQCVEVLLLSLSSDPLQLLRLQAVTATLSRGVGSVIDFSGPPDSWVIQSPFEVDSPRLLVVAAPAARASDLAAMAWIKSHAWFFVTDDPAPAMNLSTPPSGVISVSPGDNLDDAGITVFQMATALVGPVATLELDWEDFLALFKKGPVQLARASWLPDGCFAFDSPQELDLVKSACNTLVFISGEPMPAGLAAIRRAIRALLPADSGYGLMDCCNLFLPGWGVGKVCRVSFLCAI